MINSKSSGCLKTSVLKQPQVKVKNIGGDSESMTGHQTKP
jgi:hypothetical protein